MPLRMAWKQGQEPKDLMAPSGRLPLTEECKHYYDSNDMPGKIKKYWRQRNDLFRLYDEDIYMTNDAWFGVTAEPIADKIAAELASKNALLPHPPRVIVDLFAGAGGNTIAFALSGHWDKVIGIEIDGPTLACAQHNAAVYGADDRIVWVHGDCADFLTRLKRYPWTLDPALRLCQDAKALARDVQLFASPPWGGPMYGGAEVLDLDAMEPFGVTELHATCAPMAHAMFLPRNGDLNQLASLVPDDAGEKLDVVQYCMKGASKGIVAYYPPGNFIPAREGCGSRRT